MRKVVAALLVLVGVVWLILFWPSLHVGIDELTSGKRINVFSTVGWGLGTGLGLACIVFGIARILRR